jgi:hypothetical protein
VLLQAGNVIGGRAREVFGKTSPLQGEDGAKPKGASPESPHEKKLKKMLDKCQGKCYNKDRKREREAQKMSEYWELHEAEWEAMQEYLRNPEE